MRKSLALLVAAAVMFSGSVALALDMGTTPAKPTSKSKTLAARHKAHSTAKVSTKTSKLALSAKGKTTVSARTGKDKVRAARLAARRGSTVKATAGKPVKFAKTSRHVAAKSKIVTKAHATAPKTDIAHRTAMPV